ncbi:MAG: MBL fold metallo-hydrolase [Ruminococcaceae bacterium]|nr:MBL fold metallo-hydrolase [Oscillospiraceae bacterium]
MEPNLIEIFGSYMSWKINEDTWIINFMGGSQNMYLLEGEDRALLIDTGWGAGNLREYVEKLTDKPVIVFNTHGHLDHSGGNGEWEKVYMLPGGKADIYTCYRLPFDASKLPYPNYECVFVKDGDVFDLGGRSIELIDISSHSNGSLAFLDKKNGFLFVGDELESTQVLMYETEAIPGYDFVLDSKLRAHHANMLKLLQRKGEWTSILPAHNGAPIAHSYLDDFIGLVERIYQGDAIIEDKLNHKYAEAGDPEHRLCRVRWNKASFFVVKEDLLAIWGSNTL